MYKEEFVSHAEVCFSAACAPSLDRLLPAHPSGDFYKILMSAACPSAPLGLPEKEGLTQLRPTVARRYSTMLAPVKAKRLVPRRRYASLDWGCAWC